jgi:hypothetical protein
MKSGYSRSRNIDKSKVIWDLWNNLLIVHQENIILEAKEWASKKYGPQNMSKVTVIPPPKKPITLLYENLLYHEIE